MAVWSMNLSAPNSRRNNAATKAAALKQMMSQSTTAISLLSKGKTEMESAADVGVRSYQHARRLDV